MPQGLIQLKDKRTTSDLRLDRIEQFDERSREYPIYTAPQRLQATARTHGWKCYPRLDQGREGSCVGHAVAHCLTSDPLLSKGIDHSYAREKIYWEAQKIDPWAGGAYPGAEPFYEGTSILAGVKAAKNLGMLDTYEWAFGLDDLKLGVGYKGPAVLGIRWYQGMFNTDLQGYIRPTGSVMGGHAIACVGVDTVRNRFELHNSWGPRWGMTGRCYVTFEDMARLLSENGEAVFLKRTEKAQ